MAHRSFPTTLSACGFAALFALAACGRAARGGACKADDGCEQGLECASGTPGGAAFCTTRCWLDAPSSCPQGWKCVELDHFSGLNVCARK